MSLGRMQSNTLLEVQGQNDLDRRKKSDFVYNKHI